MKKWEMFVEMRMQGMRHQEIADKFGVTRQYVSQTLAQHGCTNKYLRLTEKQCVYPVMRAWLNENKVGKVAVYRIISPSGACGGDWGRTCKQKLNGTLQFKQGEIDRLIAASGIPYEQLFSRTEGGGLDGPE